MRCGIIRSARFEHRFRISNTAVLSAREGDLGTVFWKAPSPSQGGAAIARRRVISGTPQKTPDGKAFALTPHSRVGCLASFASRIAFFTDIVYRFGRLKAWAEDSLYALQRKFSTY